MSDRDKKLILIIGIIAVALLPYFLYIKDTKVQTETLKNQIVEKKARLEELQKMNENREWYLSETKRYNELRDEILVKFPADVRLENYIMFLLQAEYSSTEFDEETQEYIWRYPMRFGYYSFVDNIETPISATDVEVDGVAVGTVDEVNTPYVGITNYSTVDFSCRYEALKYMLGYFLDYKDPMTYKEIKMKYNHEIGQIDGEMLLAQYAIAGPDRELPPVEWQYTFGGRVYDFSIDYMGIRGNNNPEYGVFGPYEVKFASDDEDDSQDGMNMDGEGNEEVTDENPDGDAEEN